MTGEAVSRANSDEPIRSGQPMATHHDRPRLPDHRTLQAESVCHGVTCGPDSPHRSRFGATTPVSRAAAFVGGCEHNDALVADEIRDEIREPGHRDPSEYEILRDILDQCSGSRPTLIDSTALSSAARKASPRPSRRSWYHSAVSSTSLTASSTKRISTVNRRARLRAVVGRSSDPDSPLRPPSPAERVARSRLPTTIGSQTDPRRPEPQG